MFEGKIEGTNQHRLLIHLNTLYREGFKCLLRCPSLSELDMTINRTNIELLPPQNSKSYYALHITMESFNVKINAGGSGYLRVLYQLASTTNDSLKSFVLRYWFKRALCRKAVQHTINTKCNNSNYGNLIKSLQILSQCRTDSVCNYLYQAMLLYSFGTFMSTLKLVHRALDRMYRMNSARYLCMWEITEEKYSAVGGNVLPIDTVLKMYFIDLIVLEDKLCFPELYIETRGGNRLNTFDFFIPPLVFALFLRFLCYNKIGSEHDRNETLHELYLIVQQDNGQHCPPSCKAISWQIRR